jgi:ATP-binding protein involved in chromosome partitioning
VIEQIKSVLNNIKHPLQEGSLVSTECIQSISYENQEATILLKFTQTLSRQERHTLEDLVYDKLVELEGIEDVAIEVDLPQENLPGSSAASSEAGLTQYGSDSSSSGANSTSVSGSLGGSVESERSIKHIIAVGSGKGGVGKSTIAANLALALKEKGARVGVCDIDMYGPSMPLIFGVQGSKVKADDKIKKFIPIEGYGIKLMSIGFLIDEETPVIWRGPIVGSIVKQFLDETAWGELDYLVVDLPPGTGDAQLTLTQSASITGAIIVTTPSELSVADAIKGMQMFRKVDIPILGVIENMSHYVCTECGHEHHPFNQGGTERMCVHFGTQILARIPLEDQTQRGGDEGKPILLSAPESSQTYAFMDLADQVIEKLPFQEKKKKSGLISQLFKR